MSIRMIAGAALVGALALGGCATQDYVDKKVAVVDGRVTDMQGRTDARFQGQDARLDQLDANTRAALERAEAAGKLAQGKFVYSMVLSDDVTKFPVNGSTLSADAMAKLADFATRLKTDNKPVFLEIQGYTDSTGAPASNLRLGADRAEAVRRVLNKQGVALNRMSTISYGQDDPIAPNNTRAGRAQNRRVVVVVLE